MTTKNKCIIVPKEEAVFWMDKNGVWHNEHGKFEHPKIIRHFNRSIQKDDLGYHLSQTTDGVEEKVYFSHGGTALFVVNLTPGKKFKLTLNTAKVIPLDPEHLYTRGDALFLQTPEHCIKFSQDALIKLSRYMEEIDGRFCLIIDHTPHIIPEQQDV